MTSNEQQVPGGLPFDSPNKGAPSLQIPPIPPKPSIHYDKGHANPFTISAQAERWGAGVIDDGNRTRSQRKEADSGKSPRESSAPAPWKPAGILPPTNTGDGRRKVSATNRPAKGNVGGIGLDRLEEGGGRLDEDPDGPQRLDRSEVTDGDRRDNLDRSAEAGGDRLEDNQDRLAEADEERLENNLDRSAEAGGGRLEENPGREEPGESDGRQADEPVDTEGVIPPDIDEININIVPTPEVDDDNTSLYEIGDMIGIDQRASNEEEGWTRTERGFGHLLDSPKQREDVSNPQYFPPWVETAHNDLGILLFDDNEPDVTQETVVRVAAVTTNDNEGENPPDSNHRQEKKRSGKNDHERAVTKLSKLGKVTVTEAPTTKMMDEVEIDYGRREANLQVVSSLSYVLV